MRILVTACECLKEKLVNLHVCKVKPLFQLRGKEGLGTVFTTGFVLSRLLDDRQHGLRFQEILVILDHQITSNNTTSLL